MSQNSDSQISKTTQVSTKIDTPAGVIPSHAAASPQPSANRATTAVPQTFSGNFGQIATVA